MEKKIFIVLVLICVMTHIIRSVYEVFKHRQLLIPGKLSFIIILINMVLLWVSWFLLCRFDLFKVDFPGIVRYTGIALSVMGLMTFLTALFTIKTLESYEGDLITTGIYSRIRHPMYLGFILWLIGFPVSFGAIFSLILSFLFIANVLFWRNLEEEELDKRFASYANYRKRTIF
jgi:protein-S-isoprenylcysteine O-methyltransferase Ste14